MVLTYCYSELIIMDISKMSTEKILAELQKREEISKTEDAVLVFGSTCNDMGKIYVEIFKEIKTPNDFSFLHSYSLRTRMNAHRGYKGFYFKTEDFKSLEKNLNDDHEGFTEWMSQNKSIKYINL